MKKITNRELIAKAMKELGGKATLQQLYDKVPEIDRKEGYDKLANNKTYDATIRRELQQHSEFYQKKKHSGIWYLKKKKK